MLDNKAMKILEIPGTKGRYLIREDGEIFSLMWDKKRKLSHRFNKKGYRVCTIKIENKFITKSVHRLVAGMFIPNPDNKPQVNHIDGDKRNPNHINLEWVTQKENIKHAKKINLYMNKGEKNPASKLKFKEVREIKSSPLGYKSLAKLYNCSPNNIRLIKKEITWTWV